jgi:hypothetical protein
VSRHLRILCEAGLLERMRQGQWVHYRVTQDAPATAFVQGLLGQVDRADAVFGKDRQQAAARPSGAARPATKARTPNTGSVRTFESRLGRALKGFVEAVDVAVGGESGRGAGKAAGVGSRGDAAEGVSRTLVVGVEHLELLETAASVAGECVAIAHSRRAAQSARAFAERRGFPCRVLLAASSNALCEKDIEAAGSGFDVVFLDHLAVPDSGLDGLLGYGRRALASDGRLWLFERYESLEVSNEKIVEHPIGRLRRLLGDVGLTCERLSPIEADGEHVLAAVSVPSRVTRGVGTAGAA